MAALAIPLSSGARASWSARRRDARCRSGPAWRRPGSRHRSDLVGARPGAPHLVFSASGSGVFASWWAVVGDSVAGASSVADGCLICSSVVPAGRGRRRSAAAPAGRRPAARAGRCGRSRARAASETPCGGPRCRQRPAAAPAARVWRLRRAAYVVCVFRGLRPEASCGRPRQRGGRGLQGLEAVGEGVRRPSQLLGRPTASWLRRPRDGPELGAGDEQVSAPSTALPRLCGRRRGRRAAASRRSLPTSR